MNIPLPAFIDPEAWQGFCDMRRAMPKTRPFTPRAAKLILAELYKIKAAGHDPNAALDQSTLKGWTDVYPAKDKPIAAKPEVQTGQWIAKQDEYKALSQTPEAKEAKRRAMERAGIRRVA